MRVAIIAEPYAPIPPTGYGGTELVIYGLINGLREMGHEPILIGPGDSTVKCTIVPTTKKAVFFPKNSVGLPTFHQKIRKIHANTKKIIEEMLPQVDVIHSHGYDIKDYADFPHVFTLHGKFMLNSANEKEEIDYFLKRSNLNYVSISDNQREAFPQLQYLGTVYNGEDPSKFPVIVEPKDYICFLGRFDPEKNPHLAIQLAINKGIPIKLAGKTDFSGYGYFNREVKPLLKHPLVEFLGELGFKDKVKLVSNARCNVHPTGFREPFGLTVLEAAYCGTPTLALTRGSMPELIQDGFTGALVEDFAEGYWKLDDCFNMDRKYIAKRSRRLFNYNKMTRGYLRAYKKAIKSAKKSA